MITSKKDLHEYLSQDKIQYGLNDDFKSKFKRVFFKDYIWLFIVVLRKCEYHHNVNHHIPYYYYKLRLRNLGIKLGFSIPINVFGPGLSIAHFGTIVINSNSKIGSNCRIHVCVNIGASAGGTEAPIIGDNCYIGPGAKIFGGITIADNTTIAANAVVNKSVIKQNTLIGGVPARILKEYSSQNPFSWK